MLRVTTTPLLLHYKALVAKAALREPCDFHLFPNLKEHPCGKHFEGDDELKTATEKWLWVQDKTLYLRGIEKLCECYNKCSWWLY